MPDTPNLDDTHFKAIDAARLLEPAADADRPRILLLYGSLRDRSFSRLMTEEAARIPESPLVATGPLCTALVTTAACSLSFYIYNLH